MKTWVDPQKHGVKMKTFLTTRQQQKHTRTCHPHVMGLIWWHFLTALMVNHDMDSFLSVTPATEVEAPVQSTCFCVSFRMLIFENVHFFWYALLLPFYIPFFLKTPIWFENTILPQNGFSPKSVTDFSQSRWRISPKSDGFPQNRWRIFPKSVAHFPKVGGRFSQSR